MAYKRTVAPTIEPVSRTEAKEHAIIETADYDAVVDRQIKAARAWVENYTGRALMLQTWQTTLDRFPRGHGAQFASHRDYLDARIIYLPRAPVVAVSSIVYIDTAGDSQTLAATDYKVDTDSEPGRIAETHGIGAVWPNTYPEMNAVTVTSTHGYSSTESPVDTGLVPDDLRQAIMTLVAEMYEHRTKTVFGLDKSVLSNVEAMLFPYCVRVPML